jgi:predicted HTH domain antitoxin
MSSTKLAQINVRVPEEIAAELDSLRVHEQISRAELARQILLDGIARRKRALALRLYREGKVSKSRAAEIAGISLWEMMDLIDEAAVPNSYTLQEAVEDVRRIVAQVAAPRLVE